jgi:non-canonical purine NTP pyrophosphatase (RdgB/HAM1 family)
MVLTFITGNQGKFREAKPIISYLKQLDKDYPEIQSLDPKEVIEDKLNRAHKEMPNQEFVVEDTSLLLEAFNNQLPGPNIKWWLKALKPKGIYQRVHTLGQYEAQAQTWIGYISKTGQIEYFCGKLNGTVVMPKGTGGFGFDPIFQPTGYDITLGQMTLEEKNKISMRKHAFEQLRDYLKKQQN